MLQLETISAIRPYLTRACLEDPEVVDVINKYLKRIEIRHVKIANFKPSIGMVEKDQLAQVAREFESYLKEQMDTLPSDPETLPMLQLE